MLNKLLGAKKSESENGANGKVQSKKGKYYLEIDEKEDSSPQEAAVVEQVPTEAVQDKKATSAKGSKTQQKTTVKAQPTTAEWDAPDWVKDLLKNAKKNGNSVEQAEAQTSFASDYLMPSPSNSRRRPGPSMSMYMNMARTAKKPNNK